MADKTFTKTEYLSDLQLKPINFYAHTHNACLKALLREESGLTKYGEV